ncbi:MAG: T9SS type A sorting domain-containing protein, partial [Bacteroidetes bacterium]|nr:T9SS type A sorting domain-containing protein [Bacteroidota bacterium]
GATTQSILVVESGTYSVSAYSNSSCALFDPGSKTVIIRQPSSTTIDTVVCGSSFTWNGNTYTQDGTYTWTGTNALGCDSVVTLHLTLSPMLINTYDNTTPENLCGDMIYYNCLLSIGAVVSGGSAPYNFVWNTGATSQVINNLCNPGLYSVFVTDATGCTAQGFRLMQQVLPGVLMVSISGPSVLCRNFGPAILTVNGGYPESIYQWSNGATTQSIAVSETGTYSVTVSGICYLGTASKNVIINECRIGEIVNTASVVLYPNPTNTNINLVINAVSETQTTIRITDLLGRVMLNENEALIGGNNTITYNMSDYAAGVYLVHVGNGNSQQVYKVVKE